MVNTAFVLSPNDKSVSLSALILNVSTSSFMSAVKTLLLTLPMELACQFTTILLAGINKSLFLMDTVSLQSFFGVTLK